MKETVLLVGHSESFKTGSLIQVALDNPDMPCFVFDAEGSVERTSKFFGGVPKNLVVVTGEDKLPALDIRAMMWGMRNQVIPALAGKPEGYGAVLINNLTNIEERAAEAIAEAKFPDGGLPQAMEEGKEKNERGVNPDFAPGEWKSMAAMVSYIVVTSLYKLRCHVFVTAEAKKLVQDLKGSVSFLNAPQQIQDIWGEVGVVPDANRHITFNMSTGVLLEASGLVVRSLRVSLVRDRSRVDFESPVKFTRKVVVPAERRFEGTPKMTNVFNVWKFLKAEIGFEWPLPVVRP